MLDLEAPSTRSPTTRRQAHRTQTRTRTTPRSPTMHPAPTYPRNSAPFGYSAPLVDDAPTYPQDIRPLITRHRLRRQRRRKAATLLTGASIAFGAAALRTPSASADGPKAPMALTHVS